MSYNLAQKKKVVLVLGVLVCLYWGTWYSGRSPGGDAQRSAQQGRAAGGEGASGGAQAKLAVRREEKLQGKTLHAEQVGDDDHAEHSEQAGHDDHAEHESHGKQAEGQGKAEVNKVKPEEAGHADNAAKDGADASHASSVVEFTIEHDGADHVVRIQMDYEAAPKTAKNFVDLVKRGFYTGATFYRAEPNFVLQGGGRDVHQKSKGQPFKPLKLEAKESNKRGTISMARTGDPDSASTEFFINLRDNAFLDPTKPRTGYTVFGHVTEGMDLIDALSVLPARKEGGLRMLSKLIEIKLAKVL